MGVLGFANDLGKESILFSCCCVAIHAKVMLSTFLVKSEASLLSVLYSCHVGRPCIWVKGGVWTVSHNAASAALALEEGMNLAYFLGIS